MTRLTTIIAAVLVVLGCAAPAVADTASVTTSTGYTVTLSGPASAQVGVPALFTATCGPANQQAACPYGDFRAFGGPINRLGEGFGYGAARSWTPRAPGSYSIRYRVGAACVGSPNRACPIDVWVRTAVT